MISTTPRLIALCGHPKAGKSLVQEILYKDFGHQPVDDGAILRRFGMNECGLTTNQVHTQLGKLETVEIAGKVWVVRELLGVYGNKIEEMFGKWGIPWFATRDLDPAKNYSFGSVRRDQGAFYKQLGGLVVGINNPTAGPSQYEFDRFDESLVDVWIQNDAQSRGLDFAAGYADLRSKVLAAIAGASSRAAA
jgi:hypothetical protein